MGSNSDHMAFLQRAGISCIDQKFVANKVIQIIHFLSFCFLFIDEKNTFLNKKKRDPLYKNMFGSYPTYHTSFETYNLFTKFVDPEFKVSFFVNFEYSINYYD